MTIYSRFLLPLVLSTLLAACGGGDGDTLSPGTWRAESGTAQKGPLVRGSWVSLGELAPLTLQPTGVTYNFEVTDDRGRFDPSGIDFTRRHVEATAIGYYFDEIAGRTSSGMIVLRGLGDLESDRAVNVNVLTDLARGRIRARVAGPSAENFDVARLGAQRELLARLYIYNSADLMPGGAGQAGHFGELDLARGNDADDMLAALSAVLVSAGRTPAGLTQLLSEFEADLADNGVVDNSIGASPAVAAQLHAASRRVDWTQVAANLNRFYRTNTFDAQSLAQWIDSSGGVDRVIDRHKHQAEGVAAGAAALSPGYVAGSEDAGQCMSVENGTLVRNGLVQLAPVLVARGDVLQVSLTGTRVGEARSAFLRRSLPVGGACPVSVDATTATRLTKWTVRFANGIVQVAGGSAGHSLAVMADGSLYAWGYNSHGQLGDGTTVNRLRPVKVGSGFSQVAAGVRFTVGVKRDGTLWAWGDNEFGALGDGTTTSSSVPKRVGDGFVAATARGSFVAALKSDGSVWTWGANNFGQLGIGNFQNRLTPQRVGSGYAALSAGSNFVLALRSDAAGVWAWGVNLNGQLGNGALSRNVQQPTLSRSEPHVQVSAGWDHALALHPTGDLMAWGANASCQLGDGQRRDTPTPVRVGQGFARVAAGGDHSVAVRADGTLWAWGRNEWGQVGNGTTSDACTPVAIGTDFREAVSGNHHNLALKRDGTLWVWGDNQFGQLGDGTTTNRSVPTQVTPPPSP